MRPIRPTFFFADRPGQDGQLKKKPGHYLHQYLIPLENSQAKTLRVTKSTFDKQQRQYECDHQTTTWPRCDTVANSSKYINLVGSLWCSLYREYKTIILGMKNFSI